MPIPYRRSFPRNAMRRRGLRGIRPNFSGLFPCRGQVAYVLLTSAPVAAGSIATPALPLDLHVLSLSLAFILSQDQTLRCVYVCLFLFPLKRHPAKADSPLPGGPLSLPLAETPHWFGPDAPQGRRTAFTCRSWNLDRRSAESLPCLSPACQISSPQTFQ